MGSDNQPRFPRIADAITLHMLRAPALKLAGWASAAGLSAAAITGAELLLSLIVLALFWHGQYWLGLLFAAAVMILSAAALAAPASPNPLRRTVETLLPLLWWWAWEYGLASWGRPLEPVYATMVLWVVVGGCVIIAAIDALVAHRFNGMEIHAWRPLDSRFRLVGAARNTNLIILALGLLAGRPDSGLVLVAWWTLISLVFHAVRFAQITERQARGLTITSWLDQ